MLTLAGGKFVTYIVLICKDSGNISTYPRPETVNIATAHLSLALFLSPVRSVSEKYDFLDAQERKAVVGANGQKIRMSLYKAFLFMHVANAIKSGV